MTNIDEMEIAQSFKKRIDLGERQDKYEEVEWVAIDDQNKPNYSPTLKFDTTALKDRMPIYRESYLVLPLSVDVVNGGTAYDANTRLAWKCSVLSLIRTLSVRPVGSGPSLVNELNGQLPLMNNLRLLTASDIDWIECSGSELSFFGCDRAPARSVMKDAVIVGPVQSHISQGVPDNDVLFNERLANRVAMFVSQSDHVSDPTKFSMIVTIPLKFIHSFFDQLGFVLPNYPMKIEFGLSSISNGQDDLMPITTPRISAHHVIAADGSTVLTATAAQAAVAMPSLDIDTNVAIKGFAPGACRLYVKCPVLKGADAAKMDSELSSGYEKTVTYLTSDIYEVAWTTSALGVKLHHVFGNDTKRPIRVWALFPPTGALASKDSIFPAAIGPCYIRDCNLKINGSLLRRTNFENQLELYNELRQYQLGSGYATQLGAPISYNDFTHGVNPYLFDLSRHPTVLNNLPVTFTFDGYLVDPAAGPVTAMFIVERWQTAFIKVSKSKATTDVSDGISSKDE